MCLTWRTWMLVKAKRFPLATTTTYTPLLLPSLYHMGLAPTYVSIKSLLFSHKLVLYVYIYFVLFFVFSHLWFEWIWHASKHCWWLWEGRRGETLKKSTSDASPSCYWWVPPLLSSPHFHLPLFNINDIKATSYWTLNHVYTQSFILILYSVIQWCDVDEMLI